MKQEVQRMPDAYWSWISETDLFCLGPLVPSDVYSMDTERDAENARADRHWISETDLFVLGPSCHEWYLYSMDTGRGPEQTSLEFLRPIFLFWVLLSRVISLQHGCRKRSRADWSWISESDLFVLGPSCHEWCLQHGYRKRSRKCQMLTGLEFLRLICFIWVVWYIVTRVIDIYIIDERRGPENARADWPWISETDLFVWVLLSRVMSTAWIQEEVQSRLAFNFWDRSFCFGSFCI